MTPTRNAKEERKIHFLIRGFIEEIFNMIIRDPRSTFADFVTITARIERAASSRTRHRQRRPESNSRESAQFTAGVDDSLRQAIRDAVGEELHKLNPQSATTSTLSSLGDVIRVEIQQAMGTAPPARPAPQPPV